MKDITQLSLLLLLVGCASTGPKRGEDLFGTYTAACVPEEDANITEQDSFGPTHFTHVTVHFDRQDISCATPLFSTLQSEARGPTEWISANEVLITLPASESNYLRTEFPDIFQSALKDRSRQIPVLSEGEEDAAREAGVLPLPPAESCLRLARIEGATIRYAQDPESGSICFPSREKAMAAAKVFSEPYKRLDPDEERRGEETLARADRDYKRALNLLPERPWASEDGIQGLFQSNCYPYGNTSAKDRHAFGKTTVDVLYQYADKNCEVLLQSLSSEGPAPRVHKAPNGEWVLEVPAPKRAFINLSLPAREALLNNPDLMPKLPEAERKDLTNFGVTRLRVDDSRSCFFRITLDGDQIKQWIGDREQDCARSVAEALTQTERFDVLHRLNERDADTLYDKVSHLELIYDDYKETSKSR